MKFILFANETIKLTEITIKLFSNGLRLLNFRTKIGIQLKFGVWKYRIMSSIYYTFANSKSLKL